MRCQLSVSNAEVYSPHWSPDGKQIAYMSISAQNQYKAWVVSAEGGQPQKVIPGGGEEGIPTWSRDGNFLVFGDKPCISGPMLPKWLFTSWT